MAVEHDFLRAVEGLSKISNKKSYANKAKKLIEEAFTKNNSYYPYRLALELDRNGYSISKLEDYVISIANKTKFNSYYLIFFAQNLEGSNLNKLQRAVIESSNPEIIAEFSRIKGSDITELEGHILNFKSPRASHIFLQYNDSNLLEKHIEILLKSKKSKYLYKCATLAKNQLEFEVAENLILKNKSNFYIRLLANLPFANQKKIEDRIISSRNFTEIKKLYKITKSKQLLKYIILS